MIKVLTRRPEEVLRRQVVGEDREVPRGPEGVALAMPMHLVMLVGTIFLDLTIAILLEDLVHRRQDNNLSRAIPARPVQSSDDRDTDAPVTPSVLAERFDAPWSVLMKRRRRDNTAS